MDAKRFDNLIRNLLLASSRRGILAGVAGGLMASLRLASTEEVTAKKKRKKRKHKRKRRRCRPDCPVNGCGSDG